MKLSISAKCNNMFCASLIDDKGDQRGEHVGYVPDWFPNSYNDYVELEIDAESGQILNWKGVTEADFK